MPGESRDAPNVCSGSCICAFLGCNFLEIALKSHRVYQVRYMSWGLGMRSFQTALAAFVFGAVFLAALPAVAEDAPAGPNATQSQGPDTVPPEAIPEGGPAEPPAPSAPQPDTSEQRSGKLWICCDDGRERWTATNEVCKKRGGQLLPSRFCERPVYVCCKQGRAEWWMPSRDACHEDGGVVAHASYCR